MIRFRINLSYPAATSNTKLRQDMIQLSYPVFYLVHQTDSLIQLSKSICFIRKMWVLNGIIYYTSFIETSVFGWTNYKQF
jgi:hypothetical protein